MGNCAKFVRRFYIISMFGHFVYFRVVFSDFLPLRIVCLFCSGYYGMWFLNRIRRMKFSVASTVTFLSSTSIPCIHAYILNFKAFSQLV